MSCTPDSIARMLGGLWGSLVGDALGVPVEFQDRAARVADPVTGMRGYGTHQQPAGTWSDDGALLLCSVESLVGCGFDPDDMGQRFLRWQDHGCGRLEGMSLILVLRPVRPCGKSVRAVPPGGREAGMNSAMAMDP